MGSEKLRLCSKKHTVFGQCIENICTTFIKYQLLQTVKEPHTASLLMIHEDIYSSYYKHNLHIALNIYI